MMRAAIFDVDGTLFSGHLWQGLVRCQWRLGRNRFWLLVFLATHMPMGALVSAGFMGEALMRETWCRRMYWILKGMNVSEGDALFKRAVEADVLPLLREDVAGLLDAHLTRGDRVILLSGSFEPMLRVLGNALGAHVVMGTRPILKDGRYTGGAERPVCQGRGKAVRLSAYLNAEGESLDLSSCTAYADSIADLPLMEMVGHPIAVYPDEALATVAQERAWPVLGVGSAGLDEQATGS
jgi:HAD superfamily hydrolase (TIGR01490 family)